MPYMERWKGKIAVVTGASAGIGASIATKLVESGINVVGFARRTERVEALALGLPGYSGKLYAFRCDITKEQDIIRGFQWVKRNLGPVSILINNAGVARPTTIINGSTEEWKKVIDTNFLGLTICTREAVRSMIMNKIAGHVVNINSTTAHYVPLIPVNNVYPATKHAVRALSETVLMELNLSSNNIKISCVSPGMVESEIVDANGFDGLYKEVYRKSPKLKADNVADAVIYVLGTPPDVQIQEVIIRPTGETI